MALDILDPVIMQPLEVYMCAGMHIHMHIHMHLSDLELETVTTLYELL